MIRFITKGSFCGKAMANKMMCPVFLVGGFFIKPVKQSFAARSLISSTHLELLLDQRHDIEERNKTCIILI